MNNNLQMRELTNGCIIIDAQPCSQKSEEEPINVLQESHYSGESSHRASLFVLLLEEVHG